MSGEVIIRVSYNGGHWRYHQVSRGFYERLQAYVESKAKIIDTIVELWQELPDPPEAVQAR